jgi:hypothetical protein
MARWRAQKDNQLIPLSLRQGRILDIGCGSYPYFLSHTSFEEKFAVDQLEPSSHTSDIRWHVIDLNHAPHLPFEDGYFSAVSLLAVISRQIEKHAGIVFRDLPRADAWRDRGFVHPGRMGDGLLRLLAQLNVVSRKNS